MTDCFEKGIHRAGCFLLWIGFVLIARAQDTDDLHRIREKAWAGDPAAQVALAKCYREGSGVPKSHETAARWAMKAAVQEHRPGELLVGELLLDEKRVNKRFQQFTRDTLDIAVLDKAVTEADPEAMRIKGQYLLKWFENYGEAEMAPGVDLLRKSGESGNEDAKRLYIRHQLKSEIPKEYHSWVNEAVEQGESWAYFPKAMLMVRKQADPNRPSPEVVEWVRKAAWENDHEAQDFLARVYYHGTGVKVNLEKSYAWACISFMNQYNASKLSPRQVMENMDEAQTERANQEWVNMYHRLHGEKP
jgi:TPR repeat protein